MLKVHRLVYAAMAFYLINLVIAFAIAVHAHAEHDTWLTAAVLGRTSLSAMAMVLLLLAMRILRTEALIYRDHCRFLRQMVMVQLGRMKAPLDHAQAERMVLASESADG